MQLLKFVGCYHGHADSYLVQAGSGVATLGLPDSPGVPAASTGASLRNRRHSPAVCNTSAQACLDPNFNGLLVQAYSGALQAANLSDLSKTASLHANVSTLAFDPLSFEQS